MTAHKGSAVLGSTLTSLVSKGAGLAKEGLQYVNKQIEDYKVQRISSDNCFFSDPVPLDDTTNGAPGSVIPVYYFFQSPFSICASCAAPLEQLFFSSPHRVQARSQLGVWARNDVNLFFLPCAPSQPREPITLSSVIQACPPILRSLFSLPHYTCLLRFKVGIPFSECQIDNDGTSVAYRHFCWIDVSFNEPRRVLPLYRNGIYLKILILPTTSMRTPFSCFSHQSVVALATKKKNRLSSFEPVKQIPQASFRPSDLLFYETDQKTVASSFGCFPQPDPLLVSSPDSLEHRKQLQQQRLAEHQTKVASAVKEHKARRERECAKEEAKLAASETLKEEFDRWSLNSDGTFKDARVLISSLQTVLWQGSNWTAVPLSDAVVMDAEKFKKLYRNALLLCHPDKHQKSSEHVQYRAHRIFQALNEAAKILQRTHKN